MSLTEWCKDDDLGLEDATYAKYWITFFVFSVLPAPDSPLKIHVDKSIII